MISIIIPVYNTEKYLQKCVESIMKQTYQDFEIIIVDDGSNDSSPGLCDSFAAENSKIKVIHQKNGGLSDARNKGIEKSTGDYILFLDSDDYMNENALQNLVDVQQNYKADLVISAYCRTYDSEKDDEIVLLPFQQSEIELSEYDFWKLSMYNMSAIVAWGKLYKRELWEGVCFPVGKINEDLGVLPFIIPKCKHIVCLNSVTVSYRITDGSIMHSTFQIRHLDECEFRLKCIQYLIQKNYIDIAVFYWGEGVRKFIVGKNQLDTNVPEVKQKISLLMSQFRFAAKELLKYEIPLRRKIQLKVYCININLYMSLKATFKP